MSQSSCKFIFILTFLGNLEKFLKDQCSSVKFQDSMANIEEVCLLENSGSSTWKEIHLLVCISGPLTQEHFCLLQRFACGHFDQSNGADLVRLDSDGSPKTGSPHIFAIEVTK